MKSLFEKSLESQSSAMSSTVESTVKELFANQSQDLCEGIEEVLACVKTGNR
jgi:hypothetical protein